MPEAIESGEVTQSEVQMPDGSWLLVQFAPVRKDDGEVDIVETITDITEQKNREQELQKTVDVLIERESIIERLREQVKGAGLDPEA